MSKKVLYSPGYGAGWSSWSSPDVGKFMAEYQPLIELIEKEGRPETDNHPIIEQMCKDIAEKFGEDKIPYLGGLRDLKVATVHGPYRINEYDGSESIEEKDSTEWW